MYEDVKEFRLFLGTWGTYCSILVLISICGPA